MVSKPILSVLVATAMYNILEYQKNKKEILDEIKYFMRTLLKDRNIH